MAGKKRITPNAEFIPPASLARYLGVSITVVHRAANELNISFSTTASRRAQTTFNDAVRIDQHIASRS